MNNKMSPDKNANKIKSQIAVMGVDIGSITAKAVVLANSKIIAWAIVPSGGKLSTAANDVIEHVLSKAHLPASEITYTIATGYAAANVTTANESANDISCSGAGIAYIFPDVRTVVDIGGQFSRAFRLDGEGRVISFVLSERCAAGSGRLLHVIARVLHVGVEDLGPLSLKSRNRVDFTTGCAVFNESEAISRIAEGATKEDIAAGVHRSLAAKVQSLVERLGEFKPEFALVGGGAKNIGLVKAVEEKLKHKIWVPEEPQIIAALGAALLAEKKLNKND